MEHFNRICSVIGIFSLCVFAFVFAKKQTDLFTIPAISSNRVFHSQFTTRTLTSKEEEELKEALDQPYVYFAQGGQAFAFFSLDGKYVIKFFKQRLFRPSWLLNHLPLPPFLHRYREKRNWKRADKFERDFLSYKVAFEELQDQTGIIYTHLNKTAHLQKKIPVKDRLGIIHHINLDEVDFVVQKRAEHVYDRIRNLMETGEIQKAKLAIDSIFAMIQKRAQMGFRDRDPDIRTNCGFIEDRAVKIDVGRFVRCAEMKEKDAINRELLHITAPFELWLQENYPTDLLPYFYRVKERYLQ